MKNYFEAVVTFREEGADKTTDKTYLVDAMTFTESEANLTKIMTDWEDIEYFVIKSMKRVAFTDIIDNSDLEEYNWYVSKVEFPDGEVKSIKEVYLVVAGSLEDATMHVTSHASHEGDEFDIKEMKFKSIADIVLRKKCCDVCDVCDNLYKIISYYDQRQINDGMKSFEEVMAISEKFKEEVGALQVFRKKYKMRVTEKALNSSVGNSLGRRVVRVFMDDFLDEDTGEAVSIERSEVLFDVGHVLEEKDVQQILDAGVQEITFYRTDIDHA